MSKITALDALEILDSRGNPTVQVILTTEKTVAIAMVPSGASTGEHEAVELRDGDVKRYGGKGVLRACANVRDEIGPAVIGMSLGDASSQRLIDEKMISLDGTPDKSRLGANAILGVSIAAARAFAQENGIELYQVCDTATLLPVPMMNVINGGRHADNNLDIQEFMIVPSGFSRFSDALRAGVETFHTLKSLLRDGGFSTNVGDEGGFAPDFKSHEQAFDFLMKAIAVAGYKPGKEIFLAIDAASSEFFRDGGYVFDGKNRSADDMITYYGGLLEKYPLVSIEDGLNENDWEGWVKMTAAIGDDVQLVGDDFLVTNTSRLKRAISERACNAILVKPNQIGTMTETLAAIRMAQDAGFRVIPSHRSGETEDSVIADIAVANETGQIKTGSASRGERMAKYNRLLFIEKQLGERARFG